MIRSFKYRIASIPVGVIVAVMFVISIHANDVQAMLIGSPIGVISMVIGIVLDDREAAR